MERLKKRPNAQLIPDIQTSGINENDVIINPIDDIIEDNYFVEDIDDDYFFDEKTLVNTFNIK